MSTSETTITRNDYDGPWKEILEAYFEECMAFFFPDVHTSIDWSRGYDFLDKELQQIVREAEVGKRVADKLVKVWTTTGEQMYAIVHIEVQSQSEKLFAERMFVYNYRLRDIFRRSVASFAILSDSSTNWRPTRFTDELWGSRISFGFPIVKLLDYQRSQEALLNSDNPFSVVVLAHLKTLETSRDQLSRKQWKLRLIKLLYQRGYDREDIIKLLRFIDWILVLPEELEAELWQDILDFQEEMKMPYVTSLERLAEDRGRAEGKAEGRAEGLKSGIRVALKLRFGESGLQLFPNVEKIESLETLELIENALENGQSIDAVRQLCALSEQSG